MKRPRTITVPRANQQGYILLLVMALSVTLMALSVAVMSVTSSKYAKVSSDNKIANATYAAEAGISDTIDRLNTSSGSFTGYSTKKAFFSDEQKGKSEYTTTVTDNPNGTVTVVSTGYVSERPSSIAPSYTKTIRATLLKSTTSITENLLAGPGGLSMSGSFFPYYVTSSSIGRGTLYSRGKITLNGLSTSIGSTTSSVRVTAANIACGTSANYPQACATNDPPLVFSAGSNLVYGTVCATNQPASANILPGPTGTGLQAGCIAPDYGMPYFDKKAFTDTKTTTATGSSFVCSMFGGGVAFPNNVKITGNVTLESSWMPCAGTINGDVYIDGDLKLGANASLSVSPSLGTKKPTIIVNGKIRIEGAPKILPNSSGSYATFISFWSTDTVCSRSPSCTTISPANLRSTAVQGAVTSWATSGNRAISFSDLTTAYGLTADLTGAAFYSYFGSTAYGMSGNVTVKGIGGQELIIAPGASSVGFGSGALSAEGASPFLGTLSRVKYVLGDYIEQ